MLLVLVSLVFPSYFSFLEFESHLCFSGNNASLKAIVLSLPSANRKILEFTIKLLARVSLFEDQNKMSPQNLAIVFAPNLLWLKPEVCIFASSIVVSQLPSFLLLLSSK